MRNNAKVGGILSIISGGIGVLGFLFGMLAGVAIMGLMSADYYRDDYFNGAGLGGLVLAAVTVWFVFQAAIAALAIVGGIYAVQRKHWGLSLAGSIAAVFGFLPTGVLAIIFTALARTEFQGQHPPAVQTQQ